jgi:hypothetical protein
MQRGEVNLSDKIKMKISIDRVTMGILKSKGRTAAKVCTDPGEREGLTFTAMSHWSLTTS